VAIPAEPFAAAAKPKRLTSGQFSAGNHRWSNDGTQIYFTADRRSDPYYLSSDNDVYAVNRDGGEPVRVFSIDGNIGAYTQSPHG
jgi:Tol biopolymer transport system component